MNGRVYDEQIARFLSADIYVQNPYNSQSYNRYSYTMNNPLKYTDPSGYEWDDPDCLACDSVGYEDGYADWGEKMATEGVGSSWDTTGDGYSDYSPEYNGSFHGSHLEFTGNITFINSSAWGDKYINHKNTIINGNITPNSVLNSFVGGCDTDCQASRRQTQKIVNAVGIAISLHPGVKVIKTGVQLTKAIKNSRELEKVNSLKSNIADKLSNINHNIKNTINTLSPKELNKLSKQDVMDSLK